MEKFEMLVSRRLRRVLETKDSAQTIFNSLRDEPQRKRWGTKILAR